MQLQDCYPIIVTPALHACGDFERRWFGLDVVFDSTWFVLLAAPVGGRASVAPRDPCRRPGERRVYPPCSTTAPTRR